MHIYRDAYTCKVMQYNAMQYNRDTHSSAHLGLCDSVVDEEGIFLRRWIGLGAFFAGNGK